MAEVIATHGAPAPGGAYSQAFRSGTTLWLAGQVGVDPSTGAVAEGVAGQTRQALRNLEAVLRVAGGSLSSLVKTTCFLTDVDAFAEFNVVYDEVMGGHRPPRSTVGVQLAGGYLVEIEGVAVIE
ncbi:MAG TPA: Rid family detoxifying hydrolase [Gaiellaceae bacterium]|jgi:2-iminobutanoate/2-iminopropanoate deaminase|nr:Rid family detoxifying hydrolase [Gaiellaceae bacterium]